MRTRYLVLLITVVVAMSLGGAAQSGPELQLEAARKKAVIDGDYTAAIADFEAIADRYRTTEPSVAAKALLALAEAHESVADPLASATYARLVSEHPDRAEARTARTRMAQASPATRVMRPIWEGQGVDWSSRVSADGRSLAYVDRNDLIVRDLVTGTDTRLTNRGSDSREFAEGGPALSRDGARVAYVWWLDGGERSELRVIDRRNTSASPRVLDLGPDVTYAFPVDWLPGGDRLVVSARRRDRSFQIGLVSLADGRYQSIKSAGWRGVSSVMASPDGRFLAFDQPVDDTSRERDVVVLRIDGTLIEQRVSDRPGLHSVVGWTPDGGMVLYATERAGTVVLHGTPVAAGMPQGPPRVVEPDLGTFYGSRGVTASGQFLFVKKIGAANVFTTTIDFAEGSATAAPERVTDSVVSNYDSVMWSPDGRYLAYVLRERGGPSLVIRSVESGAVRVITPAVSQIQFPRWTASSFITFQGGDLRGRQGIFRVDVQTGELTAVSLGGDGQGYRSWADATPDGRNVVYGRQQGLRVLDLGTGEERTIVSPGPFTGTRVSPDGSMVAYRTGTTESQSIKVVSIDGGAARTVFTSTEGLGHFVQWMPDGRRLLVMAGQRLVVVDLQGGQRQEFALPDASIGISLNVHPDGRRVAYSAGPSREGYELWSLENFLTAARR